MADYVVIVQNVEESTDNISVTGLVNKVQVAAVVNALRVPKSKKGRETALDNALVDAYLNLKPAVPSAAGHTISRD